MVNADHDNQKIQQFCNNYIEACDNGSIVSIDETGFYLGDHKKKGWVQKGKRLAIQSAKRSFRKQIDIFSACLPIEGVRDTKERAYGQQYC